MTKPAAPEEWATAPRYVVPDRASVTDDLLGRAARSPGEVLFERPAGDRWEPVTCREFADQATALAAGLVAAGIQPGDRVAIMSGTRYEWVLCDFAIWLAGAVSVPVYESSSPAQAGWCLAESGARAVFVENVELRAVIEQAGAASVQNVWLMTGGGLAALTTAGAEVPQEEVHRRRRAITADSPATIVYTSGTTGRPKGCTISHRNLIAEVRNVVLADGVSERVLTDRSSILLFLPLAHILTRVVQLAALHNGTRTAHTSDLPDLPRVLAGFRPTLVVAVPRVFEKLYNSAARAAAAAGRGWIFRAAEATAVAYSRALDTNRPGLPLRAAHRVFDRLVYARLRAALGGRVRYAVSGGAPLSPRLAHFLRGAGITVLEGWGLTETTAGVTFNLPGAQRIGSVGRPLPGCTVRIGTDGEVLVKGASVCGGYWRDVPATAEAFDDSGWFHTGDLGALDDGYLTITGRKKDLIVTASGKNVAPAPIEDRLRAHWLIDQCVLVGDDRPYIAALVALDPDALADWKRDRRRPAEATIAELRADTELTGIIQRAIDEVNRTVSRAESVRRFRILAGHFMVSDELTPTQSVRRAYVLAKFGVEVEALYSGGPASVARPGSG